MPGIVWLIALAVALYFAAKGSYNGVRGAYRRRRDAWAKEHPNANGAAKRAAAVGNMASLLTYGGPALYRGWREGWRDGWGSGKEWAAQHRPAKPEPQPEPEPEPVATMARPPAPPTPDPDSNVVPLKPRQPAPLPEPPTVQPADQPTPQEGDTTVARIESATGGDVHNAMLNVAEANTAVAEYAAERQDAAHDLAREQQRLAALRQWEALLARAAAPERWINEVRVLTGAAERRFEAAGLRLTAADAANSVARTVQADAAVDASHYGRRAGRWYGQKEKTG